MREDLKQETQVVVVCVRGRWRGGGYSGGGSGRSKASTVHKQIESKAAEIMQEGDKRAMGETVVARDFY